MSTNNSTNNTVPDGSVTTAKIGVGAVTQDRIEAAQQIPTGVIHDFLGVNPPTSWILLDGRTIGNASSGATNRANADTATLFTLLWDSLADAQAPVSGGRGVDAATDFAANKTITVPDARGRILVGKDNMGGSTAGRITNGGSGIVGTTLGVAGGLETHTLTSAQLAVHSHSLSGATTSSDGAHTHTVTVRQSTGGGGVIASSSAGGTDVAGIGGVSTSGTHSHTVTGTVSNAGADGAHNNTQPSLIVNKIIKL